jgi:hypothetical protein
LPLTFRHLSSLVILIWGYFQIIVRGFEFTSLQVNTNPKVDARVERKLPTERGSLKMTEKVKQVRLHIDDQLFECLCISGPWPIFHTRINFIKIVDR